MPDFPKVLKRGRSKITIYGPTESDGRYRVYWRQARKRREKKFRAYADAQAFAKDTLELLELGDLPLVNLTHAELSEHLQASGIASDEGYGLLAAVREWKQARDLLPAGHSLSDAVRAYSAKRRRTSIPVGALIDQYLEFQGPRLTGGYLRQTKSLLAKAKDAFQMSVADLENKHLIDFLDAQEVSEKTKSNFAGILSAFITWAIKHDHLPAETSLRYALRSGKRTRALAVSFFTPEEFQTMIDAADPLVGNRLLLVGLCGVRIEEALRLTKGDFRGDHLAINAAKAKTGKRRLVTLPQRLQHRIDLDREFGDPVTTGSFYAKRDALIKSVGITPKKNGLRHSFISYRLAQTKNAALVAEEAGTSIEKINSNYRELVTPEDGERWFNVRF